MEALLEVKDLTVAYHRKPVLENFNLTVQRGDIYGIIGNNGVGKTTLLKVITGLLRSDRGEVKIRLEGGKKATIPPFASVFDSLKATTYDHASLSGRCEIRRERGRIVSIVIVVTARRPHSAEIAGIIGIRRPQPPPRSRIHV